MTGFFIMCFIKFYSLSTLTFNFYTWCSSKELTPIIKFQKNIIQYQNLTIIIALIFLQDKSKNYIASPIKLQETASKFFIEGSALYQ